MSMHAQHEAHTSATPRLYLGYTSANTVPTNRFGILFRSRLSRCARELTCVALRRPLRECDTVNWEG
eukprot:2709086-Pleurochrysis_carterae.AAC.1